MAREDLNPVEEARACAALVEELGLTRETVGLRVGRSRVAVSNLAAPARPARRGARRCIERGDLSEGHGRALLLATDHADRRRLARVGGRRRLVGARARGEGARGQRAGCAARASARARRSAAALHPDQEAAAAEIADALGAALGVEVAVKPSGDRLPSRADVR